MVSLEYIKRVEIRLQSAIDNEISRKDYNAALTGIYTLALFLYETNAKYKSAFLEKALKTIADQIVSADVFEKDSKRIVFYDGFGTGYRGLAAIYLRALASIANVTYITYDDSRNNVENLCDIVQKNGGSILFLKREDSFVEQISSLVQNVIGQRAGKFIFYSVPNDVVGTVAMNSFEGLVDRYQINLTDHAFWLGAECIDYCIEFRDYGAKISRDYRGISQSKIYKLPFYPDINREREFNGYPFPKQSNQVVIFSGGALYKTLGAENKYYKMVTKILEANENVIFWYAGSGDDTELKKLMLCYPNRVFHTEERKDLFQVMQNVDIYLSTYPICGGLMYQYSAIAGTVPITLRFDEMTDGFLIDQKNLNIEFEEIDEVCEEINRLASDEEYRKQRGNDIVSAVITEDRFKEALSDIIFYSKSCFCIEDISIDVEKLQNNYLLVNNRRSLESKILSRKNIALCLKYRPLSTINGLTYRLIHTIKRD